MKFRWRPFGSGKMKTGRFLSQEASEKIVNCEIHVSAGPTRLDEVFFDSQVWLESDIEDFYSVNGDFTPSLGNTPIHPSSVMQTPERSITNDIESLESPPNGRKRLSELFGDEKDNIRNNNDRVTQEAYNKNIIIQNPEPLQRKAESQKSVPGSPYTNITSSISSSTERTPTKGLKTPNNKSGCSSPCCIPSLARSLSFGQKKKRRVPANLLSETSEF